MSERDTEHLEHAKSQLRSYEACTKKIMDIVEEAYPNERESDYDVLPSGVRRILNESAALRKQLQQTKADLYFFASVIKSGERWSVTCQEAIERAHRAALEEK